MEVWAGRGGLDADPEEYYVRSGTYHASDEQRWGENHRSGLYFIVERAVVGGGLEHREPGNRGRQEQSCESPVRSQLHGCE